MIENLFEDCLQQIEAGATLEEALGHYPAQAAELRPLLEAALLAQAAGKPIQAPAAAQRRSQALFLQKAQALRQPRRPRFGFLTPRLAYAALAVVAIMLLGAGSAVAASAQALPGQPLYPVKIAAENTRLLLARDPVTRLQLEQSFGQVRSEEVEELLHHPGAGPAVYSGEVIYTGGLESVGAGVGQVSGLKVLVTPKTQLNGIFHPGYQVEVHGYLQADGSLLAAQVETHNFHFSGTVKSIGEISWNVAGIQVGLGPETRLLDSPQVGSLVTVQGVLLDQGGLQALWISPGQNASVPDEDEIELSPSEEPEDLPALQPSHTPGIHETEHPQEIEPTEPHETEVEDDHTGATPEIHPTEAPEEHNGDSEHPTETAQPQEEIHATESPEHHDSTQAPEQHDSEHSSGTEEPQGGED